MAAKFPRERPVWFLVAALVSLLWSAAGCYAFYDQVIAGHPPDPSEYGRALVAAMPDWYDYDYGVATIAGLLGSMALLTRPRWARPLFVLSVIAVVIQFGYVFLATDLIAHKGVSTVFFPLFILIAGLSQIRLASTRWARGRG